MKQQHLSAQGELRNQLTERALAIGATLSHLVDRLKPSHFGLASKVIVTPHESTVVPGEILWEDWKVDPTVIETTTDRGLRIRGHEGQDLWQKPFSPLPADVVQLAKEQGLFLHFRAHPTASGLFFVEVAA